VLIYLKSIGDQMIFSKLSLGGSLLEVNICPASLGQMFACRMYEAMLYSDAVSTVVEVA
jgi:hypothetical protein